MLDREKLQKMREVAQNPGESEQVRLWLSVLTQHERRFREVARRQCELAGVDADLRELPDEEERIDRLGELMGSILHQNTQELYLKYWGPELADDAPDATEFLAMDDDEWQQRVESWAQDIRDRTGIEGEEDRHLAAIFVEDRWGVDFEEFEREIVQKGEDEAMREAVSGPMDEAEDAMRRATDAIEDQLEGSA